MLAFRLSADLLGHTRFAFSPIAEVGSALHVLANPQAGSVHQRWVREARELTDQLDLAMLTQLVPPGRWLPDFLYQPAYSPQTTFASQLESVEAGGMAAISGDLEQVWEGRSMPTRLRDVIDRGEDGLRDITTALWTFWQQAIEPHWSRMCAVLEDDVAHRAGQLVTAGLYDLLGDLHPEASIADDVLLVDKPQHTCTYAASELVLVPSVFTYPRLVVRTDEAGGFVLTYGARGVARTWEGLDAAGTESDHLAALLGRTRATILARLSVPMTTSQLAEELEQSLGTVSEHLGRLRTSGLLTSWRVGRRVYYRQTPLAATLVEAGALQVERQSAG